MSDLVAFLTARLDEDEAAAEAALGEWDLDWVQYERADLPDAVYAVVASHDPARVLREVGAKRAIIARYEDCLARMEDDNYSFATARDQAREYEDFVLPALAAVYSDHPDYAALGTPVS